MTMATKKVTHKYRGKKEVHVCEHASANGERCRSWATKWYEVDGNGVWWCRSHAAKEGYLDDSERRRRVKAAHAARTQQIHEMLRRLELEVFGDAGSKVMTEAEFDQLRDRIMDVMLLKKAMRGSDLALRLHYAKQGIVPAPILPVAKGPAPSPHKKEIERGRRKHEEDEPAETPRKFKSRAAEMLAMKKQAPPKPLTAKRALKEVADQIIEDSGDAETGTSQVRATEPGAERLAPDEGVAADSPQGEGGQRTGPLPRPDTQGVGDSRLATGEQEASRPKTSPSPARLDFDVAGALDEKILGKSPFDPMYEGAKEMLEMPSTLYGDTGKAQPAAGGSSAYGLHDHEIKVGYDEYNEGHRRLLAQVEKIRNEAMQEGLRLADKLAIRELERQIKRSEEEHARAKKAGQATLHPESIEKQGDAGVRETAVQDGGQHPAQTEAPSSEEPERQSGERIPTLKELLKME